MSPAPRKPRRPRVPKGQCLWCTCASHSPWPCGCGKCPAGGGTQH